MIYIYDSYDFDVRSLSFRFPSTVIAALQISVLCAMEYPSDADDMTMDAVEGFLKSL